MSRTAGALRDSIAFRLCYEDRSRWGTLVSGEAETKIKHHFGPLVTVVRRLGVQHMIDQGEALLRDLLGPERAPELYRRRDTLRDEVAFPEIDDAKPSALQIDRGAAGTTLVRLPNNLAGDLASWLGQWQRGSEAPHPGPARELWNELAERGCFDEPRKPAVLTGSATFVGHATVLVSTATTRVLVDPFLMPRSDRFPPGYQPLTHADLMVDAVLITHSHRDHFDLGSLLRLGAETRVIVPDVPHESMLAIDMAHRLREIGFKRVEVLRWFDETTVGDIRVVALPFYGEQPTTEAVLQPEVRNIGNTYVVEAAGRRYGFIADAGRDHMGDVRTLATDARARYGALDVLFGGYRAWSLYPAQYAMTSVPHHLLLVPPSLWGARQTIMNDAHALIDTAERWGARHVVPYADGGAPWYWQLDLGPRLDASSPPWNPHFDPRPEAVVRAATDRSSAGRRSVGTRVRAVLMRPGESLDFDADGNASVLQNEGHRWPYADGDLSTSRGAPEEPLGLTRKRVLLRMLATAELERRGIEITAEQVQAMSDDLRRDHKLQDRRAMLGWLDSAGLSMAEYSEILREWCSVIHLERVLGDAIEKQVPAQRAYSTMRHLADR